MPPALRIAILDDYQQVARSMADWASLGAAASIHTFHEPIPETEAATRLRDFEVIVAMRERTPFPRTLIDALPHLKLLVTTGKRNAAIDVQAAAARGIPVCGTDSLHTPPVELTWGLILALARQIPRESAAMRHGAWQTTIGTGLAGKTLGVIGLGRLGREVARIGVAFGMEVVAWSAHLTDDAARAAGAVRVEKEALFRTADVVTLHLVLSPRTRHIVGEAELRAMKPAALLVNASRGPLVDEGALIAALETRRLAGAGLDVFDREPLPPDHPLRRLDTVVLTPHLGYVTIENYQTMYGQAVENIRAYVAGRPLRVLAPQ